MQPPEESYPFFSSNPVFKVEVQSRPPPFWKFGERLDPLAERGRRGAHYGKVAKYNSFGKSLKKKRNSGNLLENNPHMNVWRNGQVLTVSPFNWITWKEMRWHPYQICIRQQLTERKRLNIFNWLIRMSQIFS